MKTAVLKKSCRWKNVDGSELELSAGFPLCRAIEIMHKNLSDPEIESLIQKFQETLSRDRAPQNEE